MVIFIVSFMLPFVSIICITFNRRPFIPTLLECIRNQTYPSHRCEVIIIDSGTDTIEDLVIDIPNIKYYKVTNMTIGAKRNYSHTCISKNSSYITYFDDDDYHSPTRISHAIEMLEKNNDYLCGGTSILYIYYCHIQQIHKLGPYGKNHATAGTFTFRRELLDKTSYLDSSCVGEEQFFLKNNTIPVLQLDPLQTILAISHGQNSVDKKLILQSKNQCDVTLNDFIKIPYLKTFYLHYLDPLLKQYDLGEVKHKPEIVKVIDNIHRQIDREKYSPKVMIEIPGQMPTILSHDAIIQLLQQQHNHIMALLELKA